MKRLARTIVTAVTLMMSLLNSAQAAGHCTVEVLQAELIAFAPFGTWMTNATLKIKRPNAPPFVATVREILPWQMAIREGDVFWVACQKADPIALSLETLATAPTSRHFGTRATDVARIR
jgi:hypothetical protein